MADFDKLVSAFRNRQAKKDAPDILDKLEEMGACVWIDDDGKLRVKGAELDEKMRDAIKTAKEALLALIKQQPKWDDSEASQWDAKIKKAHEMTYHLLHPKEGSQFDDCFAAAARNVFADCMAAYQRSKAVRRIDIVRRRADFILGWLGNLDSRIHDMRTPGAWQKNRDGYKPKVPPELRNKEEE